MDVEIKWNKTSDQIAKEKTRGNDGILFLANEAKRLMDPYVPADSLALAQNVSVHVEGDTGVIEYQSPYAHYQYKGVAYGPNYPLMGWRRCDGILFPTTQVLHRKEAEIQPFPPSAGYI